MAITKSKKKIKGRYMYRFEERYKAPDGTPKRKSSKWFPTKREAEEAQRAFLTEVKLAPASTNTFGEVYATWLDDCRETLGNGRRTLEEKESAHARVFCVLDSYKIDTITPGMIRDLFKSDGVKDLAPRTKNKFRIMLHSIFDHAIRYYGLASNPIDRLPTYRVAEQPPEKNVFSPEQFQKFIAGFSPEEAAFSGLFQFMFWLGLRRGEALSLTFEDISENGVLKVWRQWDYKTKDWARLKTYSSTRYIRLPSHLRDIVRQQKKHYQTFPEFTDSWFIFGGFRPLAMTSVDRKKERVLRTAGLPYITNHELRHSYVSNMLAREQNVFLVSRSVGHASTEMTTGTYGHLIGNISDFSDEIDEIYQESLSVSRN